MQKAEKMQELRVFAQEIRVETLKTVGSLGFGHVPGAMSVIDALAVLYGEVMKVDPKNPHWEDRDWCVLSKGHAGPAMYATLGLKGFYPVEEAYTLNQPHTNFPSHTDRTKTPGVDLTTGSLGQGMSTATGAALGNKLDGRDSHVFVFVGDGSDFEIGKGVTLKEGKDVAIIASGIMVDEALKAQEQLAAEGISAKVIDMFTWKPLDEQLILDSAAECGAIVTAENHQVKVGLGSAVANVVIKNNPVPMEMVGVEDRFGQVGAESFLREEYGLTAAHIVEAAQKAIARKNG